MFLEKNKTKSTIIAMKQQISIYNNWMNIVSLFCCLFLFTKNLFIIIHWLIIIVKL